MNELRSYSPPDRERVTEIYAKAMAFLAEVESRRAETLEVLTEQHHLSGFGTHVSGSLAPLLATTGTTWIELSRDKAVLEPHQTVAMVIKYMIPRPAKQSTSTLEVITLNQKGEVWWWQPGLPQPEAIDATDLPGVTRRIEDAYVRLHQAWEEMLKG